MGNLIEIINTAKVTYSYVVSPERAPVIAERSATVSNILKQCTDPSSPDNSCPSNGKDQKKRKDPKRKDPGLEVIAKVICNRRWVGQTFEYFIEIKNIGDVKKHAELSVQLPEYLTVRGVKINGVPVSNYTALSTTGIPIGRLEKDKVVRAVATVYIGMLSSQEVMFSTQASVVIPDGSRKKQEKYKSDVLWGTLVDPGVNYELNTSYWIRSRGAFYGVEAAGELENWQIICTQRKSKDGYTTYVGVRGRLRISLDDSVLGEMQEKQTVLVPYCQCFPLNDCKDYDNIHRIYITNVEITRIVNKRNRVKVDACVHVRVV